MKDLDTETEAGAPSARASGLFKQGGRSREFLFALPGARCTGRKHPWHLRTCSTLAPKLDLELSRELRVVFEEALFVLQFLERRLHVALGIGHARHDGVIAGGGAAPGIREQLP